MICVPSSGASDAQRREAVDAFFEQDKYDSAKRTCFRCPDQASCLRDGLLEPYGVWGGLNPTERTSLVKLLKKHGRSL